MFEHKSENLAPKKIYLQRVTLHFLYAMLMLLLCLLLGIVGYHFTAHLSWIDSLHNASMILSGMGPVATIETNEGKYFSSFYALFSGIAFITNVGVLITPVAHRFFHKLHLEEK